MGFLGGLLGKSSASHDSSQSNQYNQACNYPNSALGPKVMGFQTVRYDMLEAA